MRDIRLAATRSENWATYDEQFRLKIEKNPNLFWGNIHGEYWLLHITSPTVHNSVSVQSQGYRTDTQNRGNYNSNAATLPNNRTHKKSQVTSGSVNMSCKYYNNGTDCPYFPRYDFLFVESSQTSKVGNTLKLFQEVCNKIGIPLASDKTTLPTTLLMFLGIEFDTQNLIMRLPNEKLVKLSQKIRDTLDSSKITLKDMQSLLGLLNFACKVVAPGRTFCRRLINSTIGVRKSYFKIRVNKQMKADLEVWLDFLKQYNGVTVITDNVWVSNEKLELFTDSAGGSKGGYGIYFAGQWAQGTWPKHWVETGITRDMTLLELFPVVAARMSWESYFVNKKVIFHVDNQAVVQIINMKTSKSSRVMTLVRQMVLMNLKNNTLVKAIYIPSKQNQVGH
ncbi:Hypothetical predicted protein [Mytilus galloprovincialis]|uniref:Reverse transcriptase domain-containing protein n=1 Tax=Mytilus galloprovincialis TaxID=29158 RepID=A0A8B6ETI7_MYTGA|nr:Hypothetical predicted protein [Mytilus galloprovincialis]